jgi:hypothetical protein
MAWPSARHNLGRWRPIRSYSTLCAALHRSGCGRCSRWRPICSARRKTGPKSSVSSASGSAWSRRYASSRAMTSRRPTLARRGGAVSGELGNGRPAQGIECPGSGGPSMKLASRKWSPTAAAMIRLSTSSNERQNLWKPGAAPCGRGHAAPPDDRGRANTGSHRRDEAEGEALKSGALGRLAH